MQSRDRFFAALRAGALHLLISVAVMSIVAALIFGLWYRPPFNQVQGGFSLFVLVAAVDVICGPLLTIVIWSPQKTRAELFRDVSVIVLIQVGALVYGLQAVALARPVYVVYERDRFRVVSVADLRDADLAAAPQGMQSYSWTGPKVIGVELYSGSHPKFLESVQFSLAGVYPAYQPSRWLNYEAVQRDVAERAHSIRNAIDKELIDEDHVASLSKTSGVPHEHMGYLPLNGFIDSDWSVVVDRRSGRMLGYLPFNGWLLSK
ncbi:hypothetical protein [Stutzerimonas nitrititolerans]|uniref:hypothetical protein n=1 Tax=Stutzerimonas nitrititolerans TaxID=2482751 RepID=UPI00289C6595|nr:hypothetical protein [Stutzerimonas nitrititolerans]